MLLVRTVLSALVMTSLCACSTTSSMPPTVPRVPPEACLLPCPEIAQPADGREATLRLWENALVEQYGNCRLKAAECRTWVVGE